MKVVFFGTPTFAAEVLQYLLRNKVEIVAVVTKPDRPQGRSGTPVPTPVKIVATEQKIPYFQPTIVSDPEFSPNLAQFQPDLFVVVAYGEIIKQHLLDMPAKGCINLHASLLPKYRGAAPIQRAIMAGETKTGVTIMKMVRKMDAGDIIKVVEVPIGPNSSFPEVERQLCQVGSAALLEVIQAFSKGEVDAIPQEHSQATYAAKIELEECQIDWGKSAEAIHNLVRAVTPNPGAWCYVTIKGERKRLKVNRTEIVDRAGQSGQIMAYGREGLIVACAEKSVRFLDLQLEGKRPMSVEDLMRGIPEPFSM